MSRSFKLDDRSVVLPRGTRVCLRVDVRGEDGYLHKTASLATVREVMGHRYTLETPAGRILRAQRDQLVTQKRELLEELGLRQWDYRRLRHEVIYSAVVGSHAWGLSGPQSDEDVRGCFVAPFDDLSGLWDVPSEVQDPAGDSAFWEVEKLLHQGLRGDANTLESLWSPLHRDMTPLGQELLSRREMFVSMNILGSFGRYAQSQFKKIERSLLRDDAIRTVLADIESGAVESVEGAAAVLARLGIADTLSEAKKEVHAVCRSLFDRGLTAGAAFDTVVHAVRDGRGGELAPSTYRPKNAYNLLRLLHSCIRWLRTGEPLIEVTGDLRERLLAIKEQRVPIESVVAEAKEIAGEVDQAAADARLPERPDFRAADEFLRICRRESARKSVGGGTAPSRRPLGFKWEVTLTPAPLPPDVDVSSLHAFFAEQAGSQMVWVALTGSHTYGFPSPDSDLDLKGVQVLGPDELLGLREPRLTVEFLGDWRGREYDFTLNELGKVARLLLSGNGNILERLLGPMPVLTTPLGQEFSRLAAESISRRVANHYRGFFHGMRREAEVQLRDGQLTAKTLLYGYRVALTGIQLLSNGQLVTDVRPLAAERKLGMVPNLVEIKSSAEYQTVDEALFREVEADFANLEAALDDALETSPLPSEPRNEAVLSRFVVAARLAL